MIDRVLIVDDEPLARDFLVEFLELKGKTVFAAADAAAGFRLLCDHDVDLVLTDLRMPGDDGLALLRRIRRSGREMPVVVVTAYGSVDAAVRALKEGATDFINKPLSPEQVEEVIENLESGSHEVTAVELPCRSADDPSSLIGRSSVMRELVDTAIRVARSRATVLVTGESGTGKELFARLIHEESPRRSRPFVRVNCAALAESLLESELFGHERGAFTGAVQRREGRFGLADGGTIFLDEIGETSLGLQTKLLRVLEEREFERVGGTETLSTDVRTVAATNRDLEEAIASSEFREDLFYRLKVVNLRIPPLRERRDDIPALAEHFLARYASENGSSAARISDETLEFLRSHHWPGNVRELENTIERAVVLDPGEELRPEHFDIALRADESGLPDVGANVGCSLETVERALILKTLESTGHSRKDAARILGVTARTLTNKISRYRAQGIFVAPPRSRRPFEESEMAEVAMGRSS